MAKAKHVKLVPLDTDKKITANPHLVLFVILNQGVEVGTEASQCFASLPEGAILKTGDSEYTVHQEWPGKPNCGFYSVKGAYTVVPYRYLVRQVEDKVAGNAAEGLGATLSDLEDVRQLLGGTKPK